MFGVVFPYAKNVFLGMVRNLYEYGCVFLSKLLNHRWFNFVFLLDKRLKSMLKTYQNTFETPFLSDWYERICEVGR